jgi:pyrophosphate--fructose-6-phosphate 1-phosphotransferase
VGAVLSGGQAPGGHNVIAGLFDALKKGNPSSRLLGFSGGPSGIIDGVYTELDAALIDRYRNTGGFDMIGSGRTKIETPEQYAAVIATVQRLALDALVVIGGDDSNTNAALLAERFQAEGLATRVIGVPKTIDGDLKNEQIEVSFGFDTACKTYAELIGNIQRDAASARKYWHFIKLMGRSASHITLECALQTHPNICLIGEEAAAKNLTLSAIVAHIGDIIARRAEKGENFGVVLVPEGLVEFIPEIKALIGELNDNLASHSDEFNALPAYGQKFDWLKTKLSAPAFATFASFPEAIAKQFLADRDPHGNVQVSKIETEVLLALGVEEKLRHMKKEGAYKGKYAYLTHFFGYEGRAAFPSNFDANYCYALGYTAFVLISGGLSGYIASVQNLTSSSDKWIPGGVPLTSMMHIEKRKGLDKPVIEKALVRLDDAPFRTFASFRPAWEVDTSYVYPGAIQYFGPPDVCDMPPKTLLLEQTGKNL